MLQKTSLRKDTGPNSIPARILKDYAAKLAPVLTLIFDTSLQDGTMPEEWRHANVTAIYKKDARHDAANYRPVSLTSMCCKLLEHVIVSNTVKHLEKHNVLNGCQLNEAVSLRSSHATMNWHLHWTERYRQSWSSSTSAKTFIVCPINGC